MERSHDQGKTRRPNAESGARASIAALQTSTLIGINHQTTLRLTAERRQHFRHLNAIRMSLMSIILCFPDDS